MQYKDIAIFIAGVITSALFWIYKYNDPVPFLWLFIAVIIILLLICIIIIRETDQKKTIQDYTKNVSFSAKIISIENNRILFSANITNVLSYNCLIRLYILNGDFEEHLATAIVTNIQNNSNIIQADIIGIAPEKESAYAHIETTNKNLFIIKPNSDGATLLNIEHYQHNSGSNPSQ